MQMYRFTAPTPDRDGTADADIIIHELTHGTSNRLHGNASGLGTNMARGMGEGWSDFYAHALLSEPSDPIAGIYTTGAYSTRDILGPGYASSYYGIRRFPKAVMAFTGGPGNRPHNPLTFADLNDGCDLSDGAFPPESWSPTCDQVHNAGEIWSSALWEVRALMIDRLGFAAGNERVLQVVTDGMKLSPLNPTFLQARDAIIAAASVFGPDDVADVREGFRIRGMGFSAQVLNLQPANVVEAFDYPNVQFSSPITVQNMSCSDADRNPLPGETIAVSVEVANSTGETMSNVGAILENANTVDYGTIPHGQTVSKKVFYTIPPGVACGTEISLDVQLFSDVGNAALLENDFLVGEAPVSITSFTNGTAFDIPLAPNTSGPASLYPSPITVAGIVDPVVGVRVTLNDLSHTWPDDIDILLVGPNEETFIVLSDAFGSDDLVNATFMFDDAAAEAAPDSSPAGAGPFRPTNHGSSDIFDAPAPSGPYGEPEPAGVDTFASVFTGDDVNGEWNLYIDDDAGADSGSMGAGWTLDILTSQPAECLPCATPYCQPVMDVSNQFIMSELVVDACQALNSSHFSILDPGGAVEFRAGTSIMLGTGFTVEAGSTFKAEIVP
jgi:subtilisin-like proprotein convertase family protein